AREPHDRPTLPPGLRCGSQPPWALGIVHGAPWGLPAGRKFLPRERARTGRSQNDFHTVPGEPNRAPTRLGSRRNASWDRALWLCSWPATTGRDSMYFTKPTRLMAGLCAALTTSLVVAACAGASSFKVDVSVAGQEGH